MKNVKVTCGVIELSCLALSIGIACYGAGREVAQHKYLWHKPPAQQPVVFVAVCGVSNKDCQMAPAEEWCTSGGASVTLQNMWLDGYGLTSSSSQPIDSLPKNKKKK